MDPMTIAMIGGGLIGGIGNLIGSQQRAEAERKKLEKAQELLGRSLIDQGELDTLLSLNTRRFNSNLQNILNTTALRSRGVENSGVLGAAAAGQIAGQSATSEANIRSSVMQHNSSVYDRMASLQAATPTPESPFEEFISGGVSGAMAGFEISKTVMNMDKLAGLGNEMLSSNTPGLTDWDMYDNAKYMGLKVDKGFSFPELSKVNMSNDELDYLELQAIRGRFK